MGIAIGKLKERIEIYSATQVRDEYGQSVPTYSLLYTRWASYKGLSGSEGFESDEKTAKRYAEFIIRVLDTTIDETMRIVFNGQTFNITSIIKDEFNETYTIRALSKDND